MYQSHSNVTVITASPNGAGDTTVNALLADYNAESGRSLIRDNSGYVVIEVYHDHLLMRAGEPLSKSTGERISLGIYVLDGSDLGILKVCELTNNDILKSDVYDAEGHTGCLKREIELRMAHISDKDQQIIQSKVSVLSDEVNFKMSQSSDLSENSLTIVKATAGGVAGYTKSHDVYYALGSGLADTSKKYAQDVVCESYIVDEPEMAFLDLSLAVNKTVTYNSNAHQIGDIFDIKKSGGMVVTGLLQQTADIKCAV